MSSESFCHAHVVWFDEQLLWTRGWSGRRLHYDSWGSRDKSRKNVLDEGNDVCLPGAVRYPNLGWLLADGIRGTPLGRWGFSRCRLSSPNSRSDVAGGLSALRRFRHVLVKVQMRMRGRRVSEGVCHELASALVVMRNTGANRAIKR